MLPYQFLALLSSLDHWVEKVGEGWGFDQASDQTASGSRVCIRMRKVEV